MQNLDFIYTDIRLGPTYINIHDWLSLLERYEDEKNWIGNTI